MKGLLLLCAATLFTTCACDSKPPVEPAEITLSVAPQSVDVPWEAVTVNLSVSASGDWGVSSADKDWCTVSPSGGIKGTSDVKVKLASNRTGEDRETVVTFRYGSKTLDVPVKQGFSEEDLEALAEPFELDGYMLRPFGVEFVRYEKSNGVPSTVVRFTLWEGRNREIR